MQGAICTVFKAIVMNIKPLLKHFPEIHHLPQEQQLKIVAAAYEAGFGREQRLSVWKNNLQSGAIITAACLLLITVIGPLLQMPPALTATLIIIVVLPVFLWWQHRRFINRLRECLTVPSPS